MNRLLISTAALALAFGTTAAMAQETQQTTTTVQSPSGATRTTKTTTTTSDDGYTQYRRTTTSTRHYDAGPFMAPSGYSYTRYQVGQRVPATILDSGDLVLTGYNDYSLMAPPHGLEWVRVGDDALLVDRSNGEVIRADYDLFKGDADGD